MATHALPVFTRDHRTGLTKELTPGKSKFFTLTRDNPGQSHFRVLVAGNDEKDRRLTILQLGNAWPYERDMMAESAANGAEALEKIRCNQQDKIRRNRYVLVVLDWNMPRLDGVSVLRAMRKEGLCVPVVVVSGQRRETIARDLDSMAVGFVNKNKMDAVGFRNAMVASILLQEGAFGLVRSGYDTRLNEQPKDRKVVSVHSPDSFRGPERGERPLKKV